MGEITMQKKKTNISSTIKDYKAYLDEIEKLSKPLSYEQKVRLNTILSSQLTLLTSFKKASNLGCVSINFIKK